MAPHALPALTHGACERLAIAGATCYLANLLDCPAGVVPVTHITEEEESDRATTDRLQLLASEVENRAKAYQWACKFVARKVPITVSCKS